MDSTYSGGLAMSGFDYIADTNAVVYLLAGNACMKPFLGKKLPDAIIAATAVSSSVPLITADVGFLKIKSLQVEKLMP